MVPVDVVGGRSSDRTMAAAKVVSDRLAVVVKAADLPVRYAAAAGHMAVIAAIPAGECPEERAEDREFRYVAAGT